MSTRVHLCAYLAFLLLISPEQIKSQTHIPGGNIKGIWFKRHSPYFIDGEIKIPFGKKLVIESGVKLIFTGHYKLIVNGILEARGTERDSIYFLPSDTANGWHGIRFIEADNFSTLKYCVLKYGRTSTREELVQINKGEMADWFRLIEQIDADGGAILINKSNPIISHCIISNNIATFNGGGIAIKNYSKPEIYKCQIKNNIALHLSGGGINCDDYSSPLIKNCYITGNYAYNLGGGINTQNYCNLLIDHCIIAGNVTDQRGGGISFYTSARPLVQNSVISGNSSPLGGGIYIDEFYNEFREQPGKFAIKIMDVRIENNSADYGGGIWLRDTQGELSGATFCNNRAMIGGGIYIEHNPFFFKFSNENLCNVYMNFARVMGNDFFRLGGGNPMTFPLDTFTVRNYSALNAEPIEDFVLYIKNFKLPQINADLFVAPDGNDFNSGLSPAESLKSLKIALLKILADSTLPRTIFMDKGEYIFTETNDVLMLAKHKYVSLKGMGFTEVILGTDRITVFTPWWITPWALTVYAFTLMSVILIIWNVRLRRVKIKSELEREKFEAQKLHEVDEMKTRFFTNISHEFRTPLTLILGPVKQLLERTDDEQTREEAGLIHRNAKKLNLLVDELLDISRIEAGEMKLKVSPLNLVSIVEEMTLSFQSLAERKKITFRFSSDKKENIVYLDKEKADKILSNVLSNAFKFTPEGGKVVVQILTREKDVQIIISDTGIGIPKGQIDKIFDRFYQVDGSHTRAQEGTGIGLSLTKELIELHKGTIEVESEEGRGSTFKLLFPLGKDHLKSAEICEEAPQDGYEQKTDTILPESDDYIKGQDRYQAELDITEQPGLPSVLIAENNSDVRKYIRMILENSYNIIEAKDGLEGLNLSFEYIPDLIISDIMMPELDGFELCAKLKTDSRSSHIPIIMLTAKATLKDKIEGLETGADDYILKPFEAAELKTRIKNLLDQQKRWHEHFRKYGLMGIEEKNIRPVDQKLLQNAMAIINKHISDTSFGVEVFADDMAISRSLLFKKINSLTGESPSELIRRIRLNQAARLIEKNFGNVSEIGLEVGFNSPSYFAECFKKQFGVTPSHYHAKPKNT